MKRIDGYGYTLYQGEALGILAGMDAASVDAVVTDPPYSSGGLHMYARTGIAPSDKYPQDGTLKQYLSFSGDNRNERSWALWCTLWATEAARLLTPDGLFMMFADWRMLPTTTDVLQAAGLTWRGIVVWDKTVAARAPHTGYFRHQCEYVVWGTKGDCAKRAGGPFPGCIQQRVDPRQKFHMTGKPVEVMRALLARVPDDGLVLDPFAGSGSTGVAALASGRRFIGVELDAGYFDVAARRLEAAAAQKRLAV